MNYEIDIQVDDIYQTQVDSLSMQRAAEMTLSACAIKRASLTIVVTDDEQVRTLNRDFRAVDAVTDVLSFPSVDDESEADQQLALPPELVAETAEYLGDIVIAYPYTVHQAEKYGTTLAGELRLLTVHGVLHLLGYDHATAEEEAEMWQIQAGILHSLGDDIDVSKRVYDE